MMRETLIINNKFTAWNISKAPNAHAHSLTGKRSSTSHSFQSITLMVLTIRTIAQENFTGAHVQYLFQAHDQVNQLM